MVLAEKWAALQTRGFLPEETTEFRKTLHFEVGRNFPWLAAEVFALEGQLGWGPGFRDYDGEFFPDPVPCAWQQMSKFLELLSILQPDDVLVRSVEKVRRGVGEDSTRFSRMLSTSLRAQEVKRQDVVDLLYRRVAIAHSAYTLGGARTFRALWTMQARYVLAVAGLAWLLHYPLIPVRVRAETVRRKWMKQHMLTSQHTSSANSAPVMRSQTSTQHIGQQVHVYQEYANV
jgi:hypothetical protein